MMLINVLVKVPTDIHERIYLRNQFNAAGLRRLLPKLEALDYRLLNKQIEAYKIAAENDLEDAFGDELSVYSDVSQPSELFDLVLESIADAPRAQDYLISTLKSMLLIKGDAESKYVTMTFVTNKKEIVNKRRVERIIIA